MFYVKTKLGSDQTTPLRMFCLLSVDDWRMALDQNLLVVVIMFNLSKSFDMVDHRVLLKKLSCYSMRESSLSWFENYLCNRRQMVVIDATPSPWFGVLCGVLQGSSLGPLLFSIYVNDLAKAATSILQSQTVCR